MDHVYNPSYEISTISQMSAYSIFYLLIKLIKRIYHRQEGMPIFVQVKICPQDNLISADNSFAHSDGIFH